VSSVRGTMPSFRAVGVRGRKPSFRAAEPPCTPLRAVAPPHRRMRRAASAAVVRAGCELARHAGVLPPRPFPPLRRFPQTGERGRGGEGFQGRGGPCDGGRTRASRVRQGCRRRRRAAPLGPVYSRVGAAVVMRRWGGATARSGVLPPRRRRRRRRRCRRRRGRGMEAPEGPRKRRTAGMPCRGVFHEGTSGSLRDEASLIRRGRVKRALRVATVSPQNMKVKMKRGRGGRSTSGRLGPWLYRPRQRASGCGPRQRPVALPPASAGVWAAAAILMQA
jgi:hypothetical protein